MISCDSHLRYGCRLQSLAGAAGVDSWLRYSGCIASSIVLLNRSETATKQHERDRLGLGYDGFSGLQKSRTGSPAYITWLNPKTWL